MSSVRHTRVSREGCRERNDTPENYSNFSGSVGESHDGRWTKRAGWSP